MAIDQQELNFTKFCPFSQDELDRLRFEFDLNGFVILRGVFSNAEVAKMNHVIDSDEVAATSSPKFTFITLDECFLDVITHKKILALCHLWVGHYFRFDHAWGFQVPPGPHNKKLENLHAGPFDEQGMFRYQWNPIDQRPESPCTNFSVALYPQLPGEGGIVFVPGSHKSNCARGSRVWHRYLKRTFENEHWVVQPELHEGDVVVFSEATVHGTQFWKPERPRRNLYFKFLSGYMTWLVHDSTEKQALLEMARNDFERALIEPAYVGTTIGEQMGGGNRRAIRRQPTLSQYPLD